MIAEREPCTYFGLENPIDIRQLDAPLTALEGLILPRSNFLIKIGH